MAGRLDDKVGEIGLVAEVGRQAVRDYKTAVKRLKRNQNDMTARQVMLEVERFFTSTYGQCLLQTDGDAVVARLQVIRHSLYAN